MGHNRFEFIMRQWALSVAREELLRMKLVDAMGRAQEAWDAQIDAGYVATNEEAEQFASAMQDAEDMISDNDAEWGTFH